MKHFAYIFTFLISAGLYGQDRSVDIEKVDQWLLDAVVEAFFENSIEVLPGLIFVETEQGDRVSIWDASGLTHFDKVIQDAGETEINTGFLLQGRYFLGIIKAGGSPMVKALDIGPMVTIVD